MLKINQQFASIGIKVSPFQMYIQQSPSMLKIRPSDLKMDIRQQSDHLEINWKGTWEALGVYDPQSFTKRKAKIGEMRALEGIARYVNEGFLMGDIHKNGVCIAEIAVEEIRESPVQVGISYHPKPKVSYEKGSLEIDFEIKNLEVGYSHSQIDVKSIKSNVQVYLRDEPYIDIQWTGSNVDLVR